MPGTGRVIAALAAAAIGIAGLSACGSSSTTTDSGASVAGRGEFPRTLDTVKGPVTIPNAPQRVVVLDTAELDSVTLLGVKPVGAVVPHTKTRGGFPDYLADKVDGVTDVGPLLEPNLERIASLKPDLILSSKVRHEKIYDKLSGIAPTVFTETTGSTWKANLAVHGKALGLEQQAADALSAYEGRARALGEKIKTANNGALPSVSVIRFLAGPTRLYLSNSYSGTVMADIGLVRPAAQVSTDPKKIMQEVSAEQIDLADTDLIFVATIDDPSKTEKGTVTTSPVWKDLPAVRGGKVFEVADETWMSGIGVQAADRMLADVAKATGVQQ
ncbi:iron-siderophore ABC transporter substrate-binding protein [Nocardia huaxiensis]|uniref:Iron-siderophore ABC transporter substrate-binding protein n=1 Tax=Nocardia huaxiensis TaxID=2755382 RepID=A0A7D6ZYB5_9NOCA|nr:iron-siderophore ABC transporter substrate-binding protein [Nocardia huaxiensis]QLY31549.1 iron-siderophore ABC transporter substrate-binding protein [Nocardia huaxiensis]